MLTHFLITCDWWGAWLSNSWKSSYVLLLYCASFCIMLCVSQVLFGLIVAWFWNERYVRTCALWTKAFVSVKVSYLRTSSRLDIENAEGFNQQNVTVFPASILQNLSTVGTAPVRPASRGRASGQSHIRNHWPPETSTTTSYNHFVLPKISVGCGLPWLQKQRICRISHAC